MIDKQEQIRLYLTGKMNEDQREIFELEVQNNPELIKEVTFNKELMTYLKMRNTELEANLTRLGQKYTTKNQLIESKSQINKWRIIGIFILILVGILSFLNQNTSKQNDTSEKSILETSEKPVDQELIQDVIEIQSIPSIEETIPTNQDFNKKSSIQDDKPIAVIDDSAFEPNPYLEDLIIEGIRSNDLKITVNEPSKGLVFKERQGTASLKIDLTTNKNLPLEIKIFENIQRNFLNNQSILKADFEKNGVNDAGAFQFSFYANVPIEKGIYYYFIYDKKSTDLLKISKFYVK